MMTRSMTPFPESFVKEIRPVTIVAELCGKLTYNTAAPSGTIYRSAKYPSDYVYSMMQ